MQQPILRMLTRPNEANRQGDIFGGWLMANMDLAGAIEARNASQGPVATVAVQSLTLTKPLFVSDLVHFYTQLQQLGSSSITITLTVEAHRQADTNTAALPIATGTYVYVAISEPGQKRLIPSSMAW